MVTRSLSLNLMFFAFSLSITLGSSSLSTNSLLCHRKLSFSSSHSSTKSSPKSIAADLISLLGSRVEASRINAKEAKELRSCLKFLVPPFSPSSLDSKFEIRRREMLDCCDWRSKAEIVSARNRTAEEDELVWWPPAPVLELARIAVDSGGDPAEIQRALDPTVLIVPDVEGSMECRCELTRTSYGWRFASEELNYYMAFLFELIASRGPSVGLNVALNRFDFFHGHVFLSSGTGRLGILFHAKEYPAFDEDVFPYNMGYCQVGSKVKYDNSMNLRNILWLAPMPSNSTKGWVAPGVLVVLDAHPGGIIYKDLIPDYVDFVRTIYEDDFGDVAFDVNYLNIGDKVADYKIFIC